MCTDRGELLSQILFKKGEKDQQIWQCYVNYVKVNYGENVDVVLSATKPATKRKHIWRILNVKREDWWNFSSVQSYPF